MTRIREEEARHQITLQDYRYGLVHHMVCLFTLQLSLVLIVPTHGGMDRLSRPGRLTLQRDGIRALRWSAILVITN